MNSSNGFPSYEEVIELKESGIKDVWVYLSDKYGHNKDLLRARFNREKKRRQDLEVMIDSDDSTDEKSISSTSNQGTSFQDMKFEGEEKMVYDDDGNVLSASSRRIIAMSNEEKKSPEYVLIAHGFDPELWVLSSAINNFWDAVRPDDLGTRKLYQSKITVKPKVEPNHITLEMIDQYFAEPKSAVKYRHVNKESSELTLIVPLTDPHFGNDDVELTAERIFHLTKEVADRAKGKNIGEIIIPAMGDILHFDNEHGSTTAGTPVGERGAYYKTWKIATDTVIEMVSMLRSVAPVRYIHISGNHDRVSSYTISKAVEYAYSNDTDVLFDTDFSERKYVEIGDNLFGFTHGDMNKKNLQTIMVREAREAYGRTENHYMLLGHLHHIASQDDGGVITMTLPSTTSTDFWHKKEGYLSSWRGTMCFLVDDIDGIVEQWNIRTIN